MKKFSIEARFMAHLLFTQNQSRCSSYNAYTAAFFQCLKTHYKGATTQEAFIYRLQAQKNAAKQKGTDKYSMLG